MIYQKRLFYLNSDRYWDQFIYLIIDNYIKILQKINKQDSWIKWMLFLDYPIQNNSLVSHLLNLLLIDIIKKIIIYEVYKLSKNKR